MTDTLDVTLTQSNVKIILSTIDSCLDAIASRSAELGDSEYDADRRLYLEGRADGYRAARETVLQVWQAACIVAAGRAG